MGSRARLIKLLQDIRASYWFLPSSLVICAMILAWATRYQKDLGVGTLIAMMLPYSMFFLAAWSVFFYLWTFILGLPVGPGSPTYYEG